LMIEDFTITALARRNKTDGKRQMKRMTHPGRCFLSDLCAQCKRIKGYNHFYVA
jgi:hypothetical protein